MHSSQRRSVVPPAGDSLTRYLNDIRSYSLLPREEELALAQRIQGGDADALERLVCANLRFVVSVAKKYQYQGVSLADLINEGNLGLLRAAEKFDHEKGVKFITYAVWWIRQAILQALAEQSHTVRVPLSRAGTVYRIGRRAGALRQELGREPTRTELAAGLDLSEEEVAANLPITRAYLSLDAPMSPDEDASLMDCLPDGTVPPPDDEAAESGLGESIDRALAGLRGREAQVLRMHFGFGGNDPMTLESIGVALGITRERVRQIKEKGLSRLRQSEHARILTAFCG